MLHWIPFTCKARVILTMHTGTPTHLAVLQRYEGVIKTLEIGDMNSQACVEMLSERLYRVQKSMSVSQTSALLAKADGKRPLYLALAGNEVSLTMILASDAKQNQAEANQAKPVNYCALRNPPSMKISKPSTLNPKHLEKSAVHEKPQTLNPKHLEKSAVHDIRGRAWANRYGTMFHISLNMASLIIYAMFNHHYKINYEMIERGKCICLVLERANF